MDTARLINASNGQPLGPPVAFIRLPCTGEVIVLGGGPAVVVRVIHGWAPNGPVADVHLAPPGIAQHSLADSVPPF